MAKLNRIGALAAVALAILLGATSLCLAQANESAAPAKVKLEGYVIANDGQSIVVRDAAGKTTTVILTDETVVKAKDPGLGLIRKGKKSAAEALVAGLQVEVEGTPGADGQGDRLTGPVREEGHGEGPGDSGGRRPGRAEDG